MNIKPNKMRAYTFDDSELYDLKDADTYPTLSVLGDSPWSISGSLGKASFHTAEEAAKAYFLIYSKLGIEIQFEDAPAKIAIDGAIGICRFRFNGGAMVGELAGDFSNLILRPAKGRIESLTLTGRDVDDTTLILRELRTYSDVDD